MAPLYTLNTQLDAMLGSYFELSLIMESAGNLDDNLGRYELSFIMVELANLYTNLGHHFEFSFIMAKADNIDTTLGDAYVI